MAEIQKFIAGYQRFHDNYFVENRELFGQLKRGQSPNALVIACSDSRVDPAILMDCEPGDLFVVRNVANLVPPYESGGGLHGVSAALEFGVNALGVEHIIVLGHSHCGGVHALMHGMPDRISGDFIGPWVNIAQRAKQRVLADFPDAAPEVQWAACEEAAILVSMDNLMTFPWIRERVQQGALKLHGWYFAIATGELLAYDPKTGSFEPIV